MKRLPSWTGWFLGAVLNLLLGIPGVILLGITGWVVQGGLYRLGIIGPTAAEYSFSDGYGFAFGFVFFCWLIFLMTTLAINYGITRYFSIKYRLPYWMAMAVAFLVPSVASSLSTVIADFIRWVLY